MIGAKLKIAFCTTCGTKIGRGGGEREAEPGRKPQKKVKKAKKAKTDRGDF